MADQHEKWLKILGLAPGASEQAVREAYRDLVKVWHPDRFGTDARLREKAEERVRELNDAFAHLQGYRPTRSDRDSSTHPSGAANPQSGARAPRRLSISARMATTLIVSAVAAAAAVWLILASHHEQPSRASTEPQQNQITPEKRPPARAAARHIGLEAESAPVPTTGSLRVDSQPPGARISFDGETMGETPLVVTDITPGEHQIALDQGAGGYKRWSSAVLVTAGHEEKLLAVMTPSTSAR